MCRIHPTDQPRAGDCCHERPVLDQVRLLPRPGRVSDDGPASATTTTTTTTTTTHRAHAFSSSSCSSFSRRLLSAFRDKFEKGAERYRSGYDTRIFHQAGMNFSSLVERIERPNKARRNPDGLHLHSNVRRIRATTKWQNGARVDAGSTVEIDDANMRRTRAQVPRIPQTKRPVSSRARLLCSLSLGALATATIPVQP